MLEVKNIVTSCGLRVCETKSVGCSVKDAENKDKGKSTIRANFRSLSLGYGENV